MKRFILICAVLAMTGCATGIPTPEQAQRAIDYRFVGRPIGEAIMVYGMPDGQTEISGFKVFIWHRVNNITYQRRDTMTTQGSIGDPARYPWMSSVPYVSSTTYNRPETVGYQCVLSIGMDSNEVINATAINGKMGACQMFVP